MMYFTAHTKATPASVQGVGVDFWIEMDFDSLYRCETFMKEFCVIPLCLQ
jgi:hypothetical protein